jgi:Na+-driven multidrug efflux pump
MAEIVTIEGNQYVRRNPLGVLGLTFITLGIYGLYWYYKINEEIRNFTKDETISPVRSLMAILFGWLIIVPPFIAVWNTANHVLKMEGQVGIQSQISPALTIVLLLVLAIGLGIYVQEHLNGVWDKASGQQAPVAPSTPPPRPAIPSG